MLLVLFTLGDQRYGLDAAVVELIVPALPLRAVPGTPAAVAGVFSFHGAVTPVIDLAQLTLGRPARAALSSRFIVARYTATEGGAEHFLGLLAESVNEVRDIPDAQLRESSVRSPGAPFLGPVADTTCGLVQTVTLQNLLPTDLRAILFPEAVAS